MVSDCIDNHSSDALCEESDCLSITCKDCSFWPEDGGEVIHTNIVRRFTDGVAIDVLAGGDFVITPSSGTLGLYRNSLTNLYTICTGSEGSVGEQDDSVGISEYGVAGGSGLNFFSLSYGNGPGLVDGVVVGGIDNGVARSRRGSGSGQGGSGGGGPYPGVDSNWSIIDNIGDLSVGRDNAVGDFNLDGWDDLVVLHPRENTFSIMPFVELSDYVSKDSGDLIPGGAIFGEPIFPSAGISAPMLAESADFNGDGILDLVVCSSSGNHHFYKGTETGELEEWAILSSPAGPPASMTPTDLDGDGRDELVEIGAEGSHDSPVWIQVFRVNPLGEFLVEQADIAEASGTPHTIEAKNANPATAHCQTARPDAGTRSVATSSVPSILSAAWKSGTRLVPMRPRRASSRRLNADRPSQGPATSRTVRHSATNLIAARRSALSTPGAASLNGTAFAWALARRLVAWMRRSPKSPRSGKPSPPSSRMPIPQ